MITGKLYDYLKWLAQVIFPALGTLYVALAALWGLPAAQAVAGTILAIDTFLGIILGISQVSYGKQVSGGTMYVDDTGDKITYKLGLDGDPEDLAGMQEVRFKVRNPVK
jgi:hypothetical protein